MKTAQTKINKTRKLLKEHSQTGPRRVRKKKKEDKYFNLGFVLYTELFKFKMRVNYISWSAKSHGPWEASL